MSVRARASIRHPTHEHDRHPFCSVLHLGTVVFSQHQTLHTFTYMRHHIAYIGYWNKAAPGTYSLHTPHTLYRTDTLLAGTPVYTLPSFEL